VGGSSYKVIGTSFGSNDFGLGKKALLAPPPIHLCSLCSVCATSVACFTIIYELDLSELHGGQADDVQVVEVGILMI